MADRTCTTEGCSTKHFAKGLCKRHYNQMAHFRRKDPAAYAALQAELAAKRAEREAAIAAPEKTCTKCGTVKPKSEFSRTPKRPDGLHSWCKACLRALAKASYDPDKQRARHERLKEDAEFMARKKAIYKRWRAEYPEKAAAATARWREANRVRVRAYRAAGHARRRARKRQQAIGRVDLTAILAEHGMWCYLCETDIDSLADLHFDHVIPLSKGGLHSAENLRPSHALCNMRKGARLIA